jgi:membrane protease YdiL (CAAX protease family)
MTKVKKQSIPQILSYLAIAFGWTWGCWIVAWLLAGDSLNTGATVFDIPKIFTQDNLWPQLLFMIGVFGPLVGYLALGQYRPLLGENTSKLWIYAIAIPLLSVAPAILLSMFTTNYADNLSVAFAISAIATYFVSNLITSGTEEFGWRGYLYSALRSRGNNFWNTAWKGGLLWAIWHFPLMLILYWSLGWAMLPTLIGFTASIVAMNYITNALYDKSGSIFLAMILHALNNTASFALILLFPTTPLTIIPAVMAWVFVGILEKRFNLKNY